MKWTYSILKSNNLDGSNSYAACAEINDGVITGALESSWVDSKEVAEWILQQMKEELGE